MSTEHVPPLEFFYKRAVEPEKIPSTPAAKMLEEKRSAGAAKEWAEQREKQDRERNKITYFRSPTAELWWCNTHGREAEWFCHIEQFNGAVRMHHVCKGGGILIPCECVNLTGIAEICA